MEDLFTRLWQRFKSHKGGALILFFIVLFGILGFIALVSDIGFSDEVKTYRYKILYSAIAFAVLYVTIWVFIFIIQENKRLNNQVKSLQQEITDKKKEHEEAVKLADQRAEDITHLKQTILNLIQEITIGRVFEVIKVQLYKERLYLTLKKKKGMELSVEDEIRVIDKAEGNVMGVFEVTEVRTTEYVARSTIYISPIWMGYIHQMGNAESSAPPESIAIVYPKDVNNHE